jgi:hypothetical protein
MASRTAGSVSSTKVSDGLYVVTGAYARIYDFFETSPLFPGEPLIVPATADEDPQARTLRPPTTPPSEPSR